jgi:DNA-binding NarL/FixJ family response regulator
MVIYLSGVIKNKISNKNVLSFYKTLFFILIIYTFKNKFWKMKIRILVADDHKLLAQSLGSTLNSTSDFEVVSVCHNSKDTLWDLEMHHPDVLLLDLNMPLVGSDLPKATGFDVLEDLKKKNSPTKTIVISSYNDYGLIKQSLNLGAMGYLFKNTSVDEISQAIKIVYKGDKYIPSDVENHIQLKKKYFDDDDAFVNAVSLTKREKEVLDYLSRGYKSDDIALVLGLKKDTINEYRDNLMQKLNAKNSAELVRKAFEAGLL